MRVVLLAVISAPMLAAGPLEFGIRAGLPVTSHDETFASVGKITRSWDNLAYLPLVGGAYVAWNLPARISVDAGFLYRRMHWHQFILHPLLQTRTSLAAPVWDIPLLLRYRLPGQRWEPFVIAGATLQRKGDFTGEARVIDAFYPNDPKPVQPYPITYDGDFTAGPTIGGGLAHRFGKLRLSFDVRYTRWTTIRLQPSRNEVTVLAGFGF